MKKIFILLLLLSCNQAEKTFDSKAYSDNLSYLKMSTATLDEFDEDIDKCESILNYLGTDDKDYAYRFDKLCDLKRRYNGTLRGYNEVVELVNEKRQSVYKKRKAYDVGDCGIR